MTQICNIHSLTFLYEILCSGTKTGGKQQWAGSVLGREIEETLATQANQVRKIGFFHIILAAGAYKLVSNVADTSTLSQGFMVTLLYRSFTLRRHLSSTALGLGRRDLRFSSVNPPPLFP